MEIVFNAVTYNLTNWKFSYEGSGGQPIPTSVSRSVIDLKNPYPVLKDEIGFFIPLTSPDIIYQVYGQGSLTDFAMIYSRAFNNISYKQKDLNKAMIHLDDFLLKLTKFSCYL